MGRRGVDVWRFFSFMFCIVLQKRAKQIFTKVYGYGGSFPAASLKVLLDLMPIILFIAEFVMFLFNYNQRLVQDNVCTFLCRSPS